MSKFEITLTQVYERYKQCNDLETSMLSGMRNSEASSAGWGRYRDCQRFFSNAKKSYKTALNILQIMENNPKYEDKKYLPKLIKEGDEALEIAKGYSMLGLLKA
jgi:hypothetical protein